jgi:hypothetical protein
MRLEYPKPGSEAHMVQESGFSGQNRIFYFLQKPLKDVTYMGCEVETVCAWRVCACSMCLLRTTRENRALNAPGGMK